MARNEEEVVETVMKRLNVNLPEDLLSDLKKLGGTRSVTEMVRTAFGLLKIVYKEKAAGNHIVVADSNGTPIKEIVIP